MLVSCWFNKRSSRLWDALTFIWKYLISKLHQSYFIMDVSWWTVNAAKTLQRRFYADDMPKTFSDDRAALYLRVRGLFVAGDFSLYVVSGEQVRRNVNLKSLKNFINHAYQALRWVWNIEIDSLGYKSSMQDKLLSTWRMKFKLNLISNFLGSVAEQKNYSGVKSTIIRVEWQCFRCKALGGKKI